MEKGDEVFFLQYGGTELLGFVQLGAGLLADDDVVGLFGNAAANPAAHLFYLAFGLAPGQYIEPAGYDKAPAGKGKRAGGGFALALEIYAGCSEFLDHLQVGLLGEIGDDAIGYLGADAGYLLKLFGGGGGDGVDVVEVPLQNLGRLTTYVKDT